MRMSRTKTNAISVNRGPIKGHLKLLNKIDSALMVRAVSGGPSVMPSHGLYLPLSADCETKLSGSASPVGVTLIACQD